MRKIAKPDIKKEIEEKKVEDFINGGSEASSKEEVSVKTEAPTKKVVTVNNYCLPIPTEDYEKIAFYVFQHKKEGMTLKKYFLDAIREKMMKDNI